MAFDKYIPSTKNPLVSILLDNYNYAEFLPSALNSVLMQTYKNFELIIVDDGSTDHSREIIDNFTNTISAIRRIPIKKVYKENGGQTSAFNAGFAKCSGEIVCLLDSDDEWFPDKIAKVVSAHINAGCHIVHHVETIDRQTPYSRVRTDVDWHEVLIHYGYMCHHSSCSSMSYSRGILDNIFPLIHPSEMRFMTDVVLFHCCLSIAPMYKLDEVLSFYRVHGNNAYIGQFTFEEDQQLTERLQVYINQQLSHKNLPVIEYNTEKYFAFLCQTLGISKKVAIYGTGSNGTIFCDILETQGIEVSYFVDSNPNKQGSYHLSKPILSPEMIEDHDVIVLIASWASRDISENLASLGLKENENYITLPI